MNKISCLIVDDEPNAVKLLEDYVQEVSFLDLRQKCFDVFEAIDYLDSNPVELIFLDINLPHMSGLELASMLTKGQLIIFTTAYSSYALEGYQHNAIDYLLKPIAYQRFLQSIFKARRYLGVHNSPHTEDQIDNLSNNYIFVKSGKQHLRLAFKDIYYFEGQKEYISIKSSHGESLIYKRMKNLEQSLPSPFLRIHNSYIINIDHVDRVVDNHAILNNIKIPISSGYRERFLDFISKRTL